ncbi:hypothetical protein [Pseudomonas fluorescens]|uniref:hypothetical protein n=1 Tax=Pseudomonas fluorescens TaxID=294 RepID=UPI001785362A|nr:hypothetical protein [Pseudomonas fluorescens]MBD8762113.1 hypothetical protein [Pseudomonas fluorescens]
MLAKNVNDTACFLNQRGACAFFASKLAPTQSSRPTRNHDAQRAAFDLDLRRPVKPRWPNAGLNPWVTRQDAGLGAMGHGWPIAAAHGFNPERGHTEPKRGAEWWGKSVLLTFALFKSEPL